MHSIYVVGKASNQWIFNRITTGHGLNQLTHIHYTVITWHRPVGIELKDFQVMPIRVEISFGDIGENFTFTVQSVSAQTNQEGVKCAKTKKELRS